jgi:hypothetical protein
VLEYEVQKGRLLFGGMRYCSGHFSLKRIPVLTVFL